MLRYTTKPIQPGLESLRDEIRRRYLDDSTDSRPKEVAEKYLRSRPTYALLEWFGALARDDSSVKLTGQANLSPTEAMILFLLVYIMPYVYEDEIMYETINHRRHTGTLPVAKQSCPV